MLTRVEKVLFLKSTDFFSKIAGEELVTVAEIAEEERYFDGDTIIRQGEIGSHMYIIVEGEARVVAGEQEIATLGPRECVGEMSLLDSEPRSASVVAKGDVTLLRIGQEEFYDLLYEREEIVRGVITVLTHRLRAAIDD